MNNQSTDHSHIIIEVLRMNAQNQLNFEKVI